ncbi:lactate utilization protein B [Rubinisphaera margarita]|uniref:lactate utilization protein B n=1 Tax=Rubinisphaera margarita TaxID=2909586 RepID=UPI001EE9AC57|nr:lactate utilization protein B [Rubinisphaera margarita]MCG6157571.1 lactate utilization protein [Rubinisphaera margarita]
MIAKKHPQAAAEFVANIDRAHWHDQALWFVREKRDRMAHSLPEWETLRQTATEIKDYVLSHADEVLLEFATNAEKLGATVHWARDAAEHNQIVLDIIRKHDAKKIVKSKSMLTEECGLNQFLERHDLDVVDTDLGERIVQLRKEHPSHIVLPAIHIKKEEVGECFHEHLGTEEGASDPKYLAEAARQHLREKFLQADIGITGVNFAIAETGGFVVCTNEGNADLGVSLPKVHIACMGIEKLVPRAADLGVFLRLLARSATGQPITTYSSHFNGPRDDDSEMHIILVDNGRSNLIGDPEFRNSLKCIRCGACMNTCPVYRRSGGHSYHATVPGPIGSILNPARDPKKFASLPHACSLCGSCTDVCPVKIDLHHQLYTWRNKLVLRNLLPAGKRFSMKAASFMMQRPWLFKTVGSIGRWKLRVMPRFMKYNSLLNPWGRQRELPPAPKKSFRAEYRQRAGK